MKIYQWVLLIIIFLIAFILRFYNLEHIPPGVHGDEAEFGIIEQKINNGNYSNFFSLGGTGSIFESPALGFWTQGFFQRIFGKTIFGIRSSSAFIGTLTIFVFFLFAKLFFKNIYISLLLTLAFTTSHYHLAYSHLATSNIWSSFFTTAVLLYLYKGLHTKKINNFLFSGIFLGLSLYFYHANKVIPVIVAVFSLIYIIQNPKKHNIINFSLLFITAALVFTPLAINYFHNPSTFTSRIVTVSVFNHLPEYYLRYHVNDTFGVLFWQFVNTLKVFIFGGDTGCFYFCAGYQVGLFTPIISLFAVTGLIISLFKIKEPKSQILVIWFFCIVILGGTITIDAPSSQRLVGIIPALFLFAGITLVQLLKLKILYLKVLLIVLFIINGFWDYKIYFIDYINSQAGWAQREPATQIAYYLKSLGPSWKVYMLRENTWLDFKHGIIRFLNPTIEGANVENSADAIPIKNITNRNIVYIMSPSSVSLNIIKHFYPQGLERHFINPIGQTPSFASYEIQLNKFQINAKP